MEGALKVQALQCSRCSKIFIDEAKFSKHDDKCGKKERVNKGLARFKKWKDEVRAKALQASSIEEIFNIIDKELALYTNNATNLQISNTGDNPRHRYIDGSLVAHASVSLSPINFRQEDDLYDMWNKKFSESSFNVWADDLLSSILNVWIEESEHSRQIKEKLIEYDSRSSSSSSRYGTLKIQLSYFPNILRKVDEFKSIANHRYAFDAKVELLEKEVKSLTHAYRAEDRVSRQLAFISNFCSALCSRVESLNKDRVAWLNTKALNDVNIPDKVKDLVRFDEKELQQLASDISCCSAMGLSNLLGMPTMENPSSSSVSCVARDPSSYEPASLKFDTLSFESFADVVEKCSEVVRILSPLIDKLESSISMQAKGLEAEGTLLDWQESIEQIKSRNVAVSLTSDEISTRSRVEQLINLSHKKAEIK